MGGGKGDWHSLFQSLRLLFLAVMRMLRVAGVPRGHSLTFWGLDPWSSGPPMRIAEDRCPSDSLSSPRQCARS